MIPCNFTLGLSPTRPRELHVSSQDHEPHHTSPFQSISYFLFKRGERHRTKENQLGSAGCRRAVVLGRRRAGGRTTRAGRCPRLGAEHGTQGFPAGLSPLSEAAAPPQTRLTSRGRGIHLDIVTIRFPLKNILPQGDTVHFMRK